MTGMMGVAGVQVRVNGLLIVQLNQYVARENLYFLKMTENGFISVHSTAIKMASLYKV